MAEASGATAERTDRTVTAAEVKAAQAAKARPGPDGLSLVIQGVVTERRQDSKTEGLWWVTVAYFGSSESFRVTNPEHLIRLAHGIKVRVTAAGRKFGRQIGIGEVLSVEPLPMDN